MPLDRDMKHLSTSAIGRKYNFERWEYNLWNAIEQTGYSYLKWVWLGKIGTKRSRMLYVPARVDTPISFYVDFLGSKGNETTLCRRRRELIEERNEHLLQIERDLSQQEMFAKIRYKMLEVGGIKL